MLHQVENDLHYLGALVLQKSSAIILFYISPEKEPGPCPKATLLFLDCSSLVSTSPPSLLAEPPLWRLSEASFLQTKNGGHGKAFCAQEPHRALLLGFIAADVSSTMRMER